MFKSVIQTRALSATAARNAFAKMQLLGTIGSISPKDTREGVPFINYSLAVNRYSPQAAQDGKKTVTDWYNISVFDEKSVTFFHKYLKPGASVYVEADVRQNVVTDEEAGSKQVFTSLKQTNLEVIRFPKKDAEEAADVAKGQLDVLVDVAEVESVHSVKRQVDSLGRVLELALDDETARESVLQCRGMVRAGISTSGGVHGDQCVSVSHDLEELISAGRSVVVNEPEMGSNASVSAASRVARHISSEHAHHDGFLLEIAGENVHGAEQSTFLGRVVVELERVVRFEVSVSNCLGNETQGLQSSHGSRPVVVGAWSPEQVGEQQVNGVLVGTHHHLIGGFSGNQHHDRVSVPAVVVDFGHGGSGNFGDGFQNKLIEPVGGIQAGLGLVVTGVEAGESSQVGPYAIHVDLLHKRLHHLLLGCFSGVLVLRHRGLQLGNSFGKEVEDGVVAGVGDQALRYGVFHGQCVGDVDELNAVPFGPELVVLRHEQDFSRSHFHNSGWDRVGKGTDDARSEAEGVGGGKCGGEGSKLHVVEGEIAG